MKSEDFEQTNKDLCSVEPKRQYGCPCGKFYLSYPALFTHIKQKHGGIAPGKLIKPKTSKARGRPKMQIDAPENQLQEVPFNFEQQLIAAIPHIVIEYNEPVELSDGSVSCQDMVSSFLDKTKFLKNEDQRKIINCFLNEVKHFIVLKKGQKYWKEQKPADMIFVANDIYKGHEQVQSSYPIPKQSVVQLIYILFNWMYKNKWTDHKLIRKTQTQLIKL